MLKKMKRVSMDSSPSYIVDEDSRARFKHQSLKQDYHELLKETDTMKNKLQKAKQRKLTLLAEVRFLRRRYKHLIRNQFTDTPRERDPVKLQNSEIRSKTLTKEKSHREKEAPLRNPSPVLDLNQISRGEDEGVFQVWEPMKMEKKPKNSLGPSVRGDERPIDIKLSVCKDFGNGSNRTGKRKISWQDQVALRV